MPVARHPPYRPGRAVFPAVQDSSVILASSRSPWASLPRAFLFSGLLTPYDVKVYLDQIVIIEQPISCAAVFPVFGFLDESFSYWIVMHVFHLL